MIEVVRYSQEDKTEWDEFVSRAKNGMFLFKRDYMDYHRDRFVDHSVMIYRDRKLVALMPANFENYTVYTHSGLTFGGLIMGSGMRQALMLDVFKELIIYLKKFEFNCLIYKSIPHIYHRLPAEEDLYAIFINSGKLIRRDASSTIRTNETKKYSKGRKHSLKKAEKIGLTVRQNRDWNSFYKIQASVLKQNHNAKPVHSADEIRMLAEQFPNNIKLFSAYREDEILACVVVYESHYVAHAQYMSSTDYGKTVGALDIIIDYLVYKEYLNKSYFDFGISTTNKGIHLNLGLSYNKESYGASTTTYDHYLIELN